MATLTYFKAIILGLVQGLAEFLPISSSGHLALLQHFFGISGDDVLVFTVLLHMGTLLSVFIVYWKDIVELIFELGYCIRDIARGNGPRFYCNPVRKLGVMIIVATIPTAIIGLLFNDTFEEFYSNILIIGVSLIITGTILWIADRFGSNDKHIREMRLSNAVVVGIMQGIAITPGISRSGSTLFGGLITGLEKNFAVKFAFLISIMNVPYGLCASLGHLYLPILALLQIIAHLAYFVQSGQRGERRSNASVLSSFTHLPQQKFR